MQQVGVFALGRQIMQFVRMSEKDTYESETGESFSDIGVFSAVELS
jgi:hypothetical protein